MSFRRQLRQNLVTFLAIVGLVVAALTTAIIILGHQDFHLPWQSFYEIRAEFATAQSVTPGQGQMVTISGVRVGDIASVDLEHGVAVVTVRIDNQYAPIYRNATMQLRPRTALRDMEIELNPGTPRAGALPDGGTLPTSQTQPDITPDQMLAALDTDTANYVRLLAGGLAQGLHGNGDALRSVLASTLPTTAELQRVAHTMAARREEIAHLVHNLNLIAHAAGREDSELATTIRASAATLGAVSDQDAALGHSLVRLPGTLGSARSALGATNGFAAELGPAAAALRPAVDELPGTLRAIRPVLADATPLIRDRLRPLVAAALPVLRDLAPAARTLAAIAPRLVPIANDLNYVVNELLYNPQGPDEGYSFYLAWFAHNLASVLSTQDANGAVARGLLVGSCASFERTAEMLPPALRARFNALASAPFCSDQGGGG
jgi:phospholipid/cholesterol/gamma-HCH transport system substrate-binding protein